MDHTLPPPSRAPQRRLRTRLLLSETSARVSPSGETSASEKMSTSDKKRLKKFRKFSFQSLPMISASPTRTEVSRSFSDDPVFESANLNGWLCHTYGQFALAECHQNYLHQSSGVVSQQHNFENKFHKAYSGTRCERFHPYRRRFKTGLQFVYPVESDTENLDDFCDDHSWSGAEVLNFTERSSRIPKSSAPSISTKISTDCEFPLKRHTRCPLSHRCKQSSPSCGQYVGDFVVCLHENKTKFDGSWRSQLAPACKRQPMCVPQGDAHERVTRWRVTLLVAGTLPPLQVSKICDLIEGSSCSGAGYSARSHDEVTGCLKVVTHLGDDLHFPVVLSHPLPCGEAWTLELVPASADYIRKLLHFSEMAHLQRSASESYSSNVLPPVGLERTSRLYAFKLMKNEKENVRKLLPYFIEKSKTDDKYVPFRSRRLSASKLETAKRKSDVCDVLMYRDPLSKQGSDVPEGHFDNDTSQTIRLCGIPLGNRPLTTSGNLFCTMRRSGTMRFTSPPASPLFSAGGSPSSSPQRRLVDRDSSAPPGTLPSPPARAGDSLASAPPIALVADRHDAKNTPQGPHGDHQAFLQSVSFETSNDLPSPDQSCNSPAEKHPDTVCSDAKLAPLPERAPLDVRILPCDVSTEDEIRYDDGTNSFLPDLGPADVELLDSSDRPIGTSPPLNLMVSQANDCLNSVSSTHYKSNGVLSKTINSADDILCPVSSTDFCPGQLRMDLEDPILNSSINSKQHETVSEIYSEDATTNPGKVESEIASMAEQVECQQMNVDCPTEFTDGGLETAEVLKSSYSTHVKENDVNVNHDISYIDEIQICEINSPTDAAQFPQSIECTSQSMVRTDETKSEDASAKVIQNEDSSHDEAAVICESAQTNTTDVSSLSSFCPDPCDVKNTFGIESKKFHDNFSISENLKAQDLSLSENMSELDVVEKLFDDILCDSRSVDSSHLFDSRVLAEPQVLLATSIQKSSSSIVDAQSSLKHEMDEEMLEKPELILSENNRGDSLSCLEFQDSISVNLVQETNGVSSEEYQDLPNLPVASKSQEMHSIDQIQGIESDPLKLSFDRETVPVSTFEDTIDLGQLPVNLNWSTVCDEVKNVVEPYFEKAVDTFIDEGPDITSYLLNEQTFIERGVACDESKCLPLEKTAGENLIIVSTPNVSAELSSGLACNQSSVEVSKCTTFVDDTFTPGESDISTLCETSVEIDPLIHANGTSDVHVESFCAEINESPSQTDGLTSSSKIISIVEEINSGINENSLDPKLTTDGLTSFSINATSDQITETSVCTININPTSISESVVQVSSCNIQPDDCESHGTDSDVLPQARISRPRKTCANDLNRGQALADRAAKIARMHGASPSKPRPFAFPADVIRSPSQISKNVQSSFVSKVPNIDACAIRSKSASPMTHKRVKRETTAKRLKSTSPNNRLRVNLVNNNGTPIENSEINENNSIPAVVEQITTTESQSESKRQSFINTVYVKVPSTGEVNSSPEVSSPATYISNFTRVTYSDVSCNDRDEVDPAKQKTVRTELKLPRVSLIEEVEKINDDLTRWASYLANKMLLDIFDFDSPKWRKDYFSRVCPVPEKNSCFRDIKPANSCSSYLVKTAESPDSVSNDDSLSFAQEPSKRGAAVSSGNSASSADRRTAREEDSTASSSFSSEAWWGQGGPVTHREQLPLKEDVELAPQWPGLPVPSVPESDVDRAGYASDDDFEAMDEDMRRLEEKIRQFEHELEEDLEMSLAEETSHRMPNFGLLDKAKLRSSPLPTEYPPVCLKKTKHFSFMSKKDIDDYLKSDSESGSSSSSSFDDDLFFVKKKIKLKPGDRKCFSLDLKKRSLIDECKSECLMKILSIAEADQKTEKMPDEAISDMKTEEHKSEECLIENEFKMIGQYWRSEDGLAVVDSEGLADFYAGANPSGVCFIFEDESEDEETLNESIAIAFGEPDIPLHEPSLESCCTSTPTEDTAESVVIPSNPPVSKADKKSKFVSSFKNSFVKATKSIGPKFAVKSSESAYENPIQSGANSPLLIDPASFISEILSGKTKPDSATPKPIDVDNVATFPASSESDACDSSVISGEYYASPAICVLSDEDSHVPEYNLFQQPSPRHEQALSSLSAPTPPIRKSSLDAVSTATGSFRRQSGGKQEAAPHRMVAEIPSVLPPPPSVPPRTTTLNYYPVRSHPIQYRNTVKSDVNVDSFYKDIDYSSRQPDSAQRPKTTSVRQLKRRQQERKLELAEEAKEEATGCNFCLRRSRTLQDSRHNRVQLRRSSPHPKALLLPQRRSWPPRVSSCMACFRWWSLPCHLPSTAASNNLVAFDCLKPTEQQPRVEDKDDDRDTVSSSSVPCPENPNSPRSDLADASAFWSDDSRSDSEFLWTPCALSLSICKQEDDSMLPVNTSQSLYRPPCFDRVVCPSLTEPHECNWRHSSVSVSKCMALGGGAASEMTSLNNLSLLLPVTLYRSLPLSNNVKNSLELPVSIFSTSCPQLIFYSIPNFLSTEELLPECSGVSLSSSLSSNDISRDVSYHVPTSSFRCCPLMAYSASQSDLSSDH